MKISRLIESISSLVITSNFNKTLLEEEVFQLTNNSRNIKDSCIFICRKGSVFDSHNLVTELYKERKVKLFIVEKPVDPCVPYLQVFDTRVTEAHLASVFYDSPYMKLITFGVTGTNGKTTCAHLFHHILTQMGLQGSLSGTIMNDIMGDKSYSHNTTPDALNLISNMKKTFDSGGQFYSMEVSSHAIDQYRVETVKFDIVGLTNITRDHLDYHPSFEHYKKTKLRIFDFLKYGGIGVVKEEFKEEVEKLNHKNERRIVSFGISNSVDYKIEDIETSWKGTTFTLKTKDWEKRVYSQVVGEYNAFNITLVVAGLVEIGYDVNEILTHVSTFRGVDGRFEPIPEARKLGIEVVIDFAHSPDALEKVIMSARKLVKNGRIITVYGAGGHADKGKRPMMAEVVTKLSDISILTTDDPRGERPEDIIAEVEKGIVPGTLNMTVINRREAIDTAIALASKGDVVLITGRGHEPYQIFDDTLKIPFKDRDVALEIILSKINKAGYSRDDRNI